MTSPRLLLALEKIDRSLCTRGGVVALRAEADSPGHVFVSVTGLAESAHAWLALGRRIIPLPPGSANSPRTHRFSTRAGLKRLALWSRGTDDRPRLLDVRWVTVPGDDGDRPAAHSGETEAAAPVARSRLTVLVPNYNHAAYLPPRLDSIYQQTRQPDEILLLDDASTDHSAEVLAAYAARDPVPGRTRLIRNTENSGGPFAQWARGLREATGDLIWIAESDDWCAPDFLERLLPAFANPAVVLAHGLVQFVDKDGRPLDQTHDALFRSLPSRKWRRSHVEAAHREVQLGLGVRNLLPNASAVVLRRPAHLPLLDDPEWRRLRVCGDWIFYLHVLRGGSLAFVREAHAFYRTHAASTSLGARHGDAYHAEHALVLRHLASTYRLDGDADVPARMREFLRRQHSRRSASAEELARAVPDLWFAPETLRPHAARRAPNVLVAYHSVSRGGAERFALRLAGALRELGCAVTLGDTAAHLPDADGRAGGAAAWASGFPIIALDERSPRRVARQLLAHGIEWISTHHHRADLVLAQAKVLLPAEARPRLFCTHHGFYHLDAAKLFRERALFARAVDLWVHVAARGRQPFECAGLARAGAADERFVHWPVAADATTPTAPVARASLGLSAEAFVVCVASRAIREKGWREAISAVAAARGRTGRDIRLLLVGAGPEEKALRAGGVPPFVSLLGYRQDVGALYGAADLGLLATTFAGESCPLTVLECLAAGRPAVVTAVGETPTMLAAADGGVAGALVPLDPPASLAERVAEALSLFASDPARLAAAAARSQGCAKRYDIREVARAHLDRYHALASSTDS